MAQPCRQARPVGARETPWCRTGSIAAGSSWRSRARSRPRSGTGLGKGQAERVVETTFAASTAAAGDGDEVNLTGFGKFKVADRPARRGRDPATGETIEIAASKKLTFTAAKTILDALNKV